MTSTLVVTEVLKQDSRGRVRVSVERRESLLDEFERSGASGAKFARLAGIKYATFANWVQKRRKRCGALSTTARSAPGRSDSVGSGGAVRLFEAVIEGGVGRARPLAGSLGLVVELPGGSRMVVESPVQMQMAA